jgi:hypothetical protein
VAAKSPLAPSNDMSIPSLIEKNHPQIKLSSGPHGRTLLATQRIPAFTEVLSENAILWYPPSCNTLAATIPGMACFNPAITREQAEGLLLQLCPYSPDSGMKVKGGAKPPLIRSDVYPKVANLNALGALVDEDAPANNRRIPMICPVIAMCQHSCAPNCSYEGFYAPASRAPGIRVFSECDIEEGEEVTISYIPRHLPLPQRRAQLLDSYHFHCACPRCESGVEDTVVFKCLACKSGAVAEGERVCGVCGEGSPHTIPPGLRDTFLEMAAGNPPLLLSPTCPLHTNDQGLYSALYACLAGLWQGGGVGVGGAGSGGVDLPTLRCTASAVACNSASVSRVGRGPAFTCDALLIAGHFHAFAGRVKEASAFYTRAAVLYGAMFGGSDPRVTIARSLASKPPTSPRAAELAERARLERSANWGVLYGLPAELLALWSKGAPRRSVGGGAAEDGAAMREIIQLSREKEGGE